MNKRCILILGLALLGFGCAPRKPATENDGPGVAARPEASPIGSSEAASLAVADRPVESDVPLSLPADAPKDAKQAVPVMFSVDVYQIAVPRGAISGDETFWKRANENILDPGTYDVLRRNGIRVGEATLGEWPYFADLLADHPTITQQASVGATRVQGLTLEMRKDVDGQNLFYYDTANVLRGRTFDRCDNLLLLGFTPAPRKPGVLRLTMMPVVRAQRKRLEYSINNDERGEVQYVSPESQVDMNLIVDIPADNFLIVAPSPEASWPVSVGQLFFYRDGQAEKQEVLLLIVPRPYQVKPGKSGRNR